MEIEVVVERKEAALDATELVKAQGAEERKEGEEEGQDKKMREERQWLKKE